MDQYLKSLMNKYLNEAKKYQQLSKPVETPLPPQQEPSTSEVSEISQQPSVIQSNEQSPTPENEQFSDTQLQEPSSLQLQTDQDTSHIIHDRYLNENTVNINTQYIPPENQDQTLIQGATKGLDGSGFLIIQVFTAKSALPLGNALVTVTSKDEDTDKIIYRLITDRNGKTTTVSLPTVSFEMSQQPEITVPYATYNIRIDSPGYFSVQNINVPIFDRETTIQPVEMIPVPENYIGNTLTQFDQTGPNL